MSLSSEVITSHSYSGNPFCRVSSTGITVLVLHPFQRDPWKLSLNTLFYLVVIWIWFFLNVTLFRTVFPNNIFNYTHESWLIFVSNWWIVINMMNKVVSRLFSSHRVLTVTVLFPTPDDFEVWLVVRVWIPSTTDIERKYLSVYCPGRNKSPDPDSETLVL